MKRSWIQTYNEYFAVTFCLKNCASPTFLSDKDRDYFLETLKHPTAPNQKLKDAFEEYNLKFEEIKCD